MISIDPRNHTPIYEQIVRGVRDAIDAGVYRSGEMLPSLRALALELRVNPNTVQRAYEQLERSGVIESRRGVGMFVASPKTLAVNSAAEKRVVRAFREGVRAARSAAMPPEQIRALFDAALHQPSTTTRRR